MILLSPEVLNGIHPADFWDTVRRSLPDGFTVADVTVDQKTGCARIHRGTHILIIGCPSCLTLKRGQAGDGRPMIGDRLLTSFEEWFSGSDEQAETYPAEIRANLWFCPGCKMLVHGTMPKFDTMADRPS